MGMKKNKKLILYSLILCTISSIVGVMLSTVGFRGELTVLKDKRGYRFIAYLLDNPGKGIFPLLLFRVGNPSDPMKYSEIMEIDETTGPESKYTGKNLSTTTSSLDRERDYKFAPFIIGYSRFTPD